MYIFQYFNNFANILIVTPIFLKFLQYIYSFFKKISESLKIGLELGLDFSTLILFICMLNKSS